MILLIGCKTEFVTPDPVNVVSLEVMLDESPFQYSSATFFLDGEHKEMFGNYRTDENLGFHRLTLSEYGFVESAMGPFDGLSFDFSISENPTDETTLAPLTNSDSFYSIGVADEISAIYIIVANELNQITYRIDKDGTLIGSGTLHFVQLGSGNQDYPETIKITDLRFRIEDYDI